MVPQTSIRVPLTHDEFTALSSDATQSLRHPRDQARYIIRTALGLTEDRRDNAGIVQATNQDSSVVTVHN